ncbi:MAG TPA: DUF4296 domain-containing protein [Flavobacterium sp.]|jgi:hypothetical protein|nr:DUF4296 domain-containing protein [Flavobacterium sp.]HQX02606.1 DUF4296 domain-containing protein [Flavobacterium sp.]HRZ32421.1 DUF4296 domain-containing protein [Flavobacterium sp.]HRZ74963.1 DUF4296 domain-containing protein [Flavobacterium sp.]
MKIKHALFFFSFFFFACQKEKVKVPEKLIEEETMVSIFYDLSLLDAIRSNNSILLEENKIDPYTYIYKKYKIDSLQFAQNNIYYAYDLKRYKSMYERVEKRLEEEKKIADSTVLKPGKIEEPPSTQKDTIQTRIKEGFLKNKELRKNKD